jgi:hypothetical protein
VAANYKKFPCACGIGRTFIKKPKFAYPEDSERCLSTNSRCAILLTSPPGVVGKAVLDEGMAAVTADGSGVFDPLAALRAGFAGGRARKH